MRDSDDSQTSLANRLRTDLPDLRFFVLSDVWLDHPETMNGLRKLFENCEDNNFIPKVIVLCGNFSSRGLAQGNAREIRGYQGEPNSTSLVVKRLKIHRELRLPGRSHIFLPLDCPHSTLRHCPRAVRCHHQFCIASSSYHIIIHVAPQVKSSQYTLWHEPLPDKVLRPRDGHFQRRPHGAHVA